MKLPKEVKINLVISFQLSLKSNVVCCSMTILHNNCQPVKNKLHYGFH